MYRDVLKQKLDHIEDVERARTNKRMPVVLTRAEVNAVLNHLTGIPYLAAALMCGSGLRLMECLRLRVGSVAVSLFSLCNLCVLCVSAVNLKVNLMAEYSPQRHREHGGCTEEFQRAQCSMLTALFFSRFRAEAPVFETTCAFASS